MYSPARMSTVRETGSYSKPRQASRRGLAHRQGRREAAVGVEVVVLGDAHDARVAAVREVGPSIGAGQVDARRQQFARGVSDPHPHLPGRLRPRVVVDPHPPGLAASPRDDVEPEPHPVVDGARLVVGPSVARVHDVPAIGRPRREVLVRARVREPHGLDASGRFLTGDGVDVVVAGGVRDIGDDAPVRGDDRRRLVVGLDPNEEFRLSRAGAPSPEGTGAERGLAPPRHEYDIPGAADPVPRHVVGLRVGDHGHGLAALHVVRPQVEGAVALGGEEDPAAVRRPAGAQVEEGVRGEPTGFPGCRTAARPHLNDEDVEVAVDVRRVRDVGAVGRPARLGVVARPARDLLRRATLDRHHPDAPLVGEGDGGAVGGPGRIRGRGGDRRREVALHVHPARAARRPRGSGSRPGRGLGTRAAAAAVCSD